MVPMLAVWNDEEELVENEGLLVVMEEEVEDRQRGWMLLGMVVDEDEDEK